MAAFDTETYCKIVVVVDEDIDIFDLADVMWVVATRSRADRDLVFVHRAMGAILDPTSDPVDNTLTKSASTDQARRRRLRRASDDRPRAARLVFHILIRRLTGANTAKIAFLAPDRPVCVKKYNTKSAGWMRNSLLGGSTEFFERSTNFDGPNNGLTIE
jgi:hypothetical protein